MEQGVVDSVHYGKVEDPFPELTYHALTLGPMIR